MKFGRVVLLTVGSLIALVGFGLIGVGASLGWATATQRDDAGAFDTAPGMSEASRAASSSPSSSPPLRTRTATRATGVHGSVIDSIPIIAAPIESKSWIGSRRA